jgi:hypothetical protein
LFQKQQKKSTATKEDEHKAATCRIQKPYAMAGPYSSPAASAAVHFASGWRIPIVLHGAWDTSTRSIRFNPTVSSTSGIFF